MLNNEKEIVLSLLDIVKFVYVNFQKNKDILIKNSDIIFQTFIDLIKKLLSNEKTELKILKYATNVIRKISDIKELINSISLQTHINLIKLVFNYVSYEDKNRLEEDEEGAVIRKSYNSLMLHIIDYCNFSENICIIIDIIKTNVKEEKLKLYEYGSRSLAIINKIIKDMHKQLKINDILKEIHLFLVEFEIRHPGLEINNKKEKEIIESITELIYELVKARGDSIIDEYNKEIEIFGKNDKYILNWIKEDLNKIKEEEREREFKISIDEDIENLISGELLTNL